MGWWHFGHVSMSVSMCSNGNSSSSNAYPFRDRLLSAGGDVGDLPPPRQEHRRTGSSESQEQQKPAGESASSVAASSVAGALELTAERVCFFLRQLGCSIKVTPGGGEQKDRKAILTVPLTFPRAGQGPPARK